MQRCSPFAEVEENGKFDARNKNLIRAVWPSICNQLVTFSTLSCRIPSPSKLKLFFLWDFKIFMEDVNRNLTTETVQTNFFTFPQHKNSRKYKAKLITKSFNKNVFQTRTKGLWAWKWLQAFQINVPQMKSQWKRVTLYICNYLLGNSIITTEVIKLTSSQISILGGNFKSQQLEVHRGRDKRTK